MQHINTEAYFKRIGYSGPENATLETLQQIHFLHPQSIPFENFNPYLRIPVNLDPDAIQQKLVHSQRGGYCFEHNLLLSAVLKKLGFKVRQLEANVLWNIPEGITMPRTHMLLRVEIEEKSYIADVGFGGPTLTGPLLLEPGIEQETPHEKFRLLKQGDSFILQIMIKQEWQSLYRFDLQEQSLADYQLANYYLSNYPGSHFITGIIAARAPVGKRYALRNNQFTIHHVHGETEKKEVQELNELKQIIREVFLIELPDIEGVDEKLMHIYTNI